MVQNPPQVGDAGDAACGTGKSRGIGDPAAAAANNFYHCAPHGAHDLVLGAIAEQVGLNTPYTFTFHLDRARPQGGLLHGACAGFRATAFHHRLATDYTTDGVTIRVLLRDASGATLHAGPQVTLNWC